MTGSRSGSDRVHFVVLIGVSGAGKSTLAHALADRLGWDLLEGDDLHDPHNVARMSAGEELGDEQRRPWLHEIAQWIDSQAARRRSGVVTCSALKRSYRDLLRRSEVTFVHLQPPRRVLERRLRERTGHFMPPSLLGSQFAILEQPEPDEHAMTIDSAGPPEELVDSIVERLGLETNALASDASARRERSMQIGMVGLGKMGGNMVARLREQGHAVIGYDQAADAPRDVTSLEQLVAALQPARVVWLMLPAGDVTRDTVAMLARQLQAGDLVVDGANSRYTDDAANAALLAAHGIDYVDAGISGGIHGLREGYGVMVGGTAQVVGRLQPVLDALTPSDGGFVHAGPVGAGHFAKMVHNGIEYGLMQAYAEGYELLTASDLIDSPAAIIDAWQHGTVIRSWLLELLGKALADVPDLAGIRGYARDSGEGRWAIEAGVEHAVPLPVMSAALFARFASRQQESPAMQVVAALREQFGGHATEPAAAGDREGHTGESDS